jgi:pimeloyl-ACP methyl ester carboxylesterase
VLLVHGWQWNRLGETAEDGMANILGTKPVDLMRLAYGLHQEGFQVLMFDLRNHGESAEQTPLTFGREEAADVLGSVGLFAQTAGRARNDRIGVIGFSAGANALLYALSQTELVRAAIAVQPASGGAVFRAHGGIFIRPLPGADRTVGEIVSIRPLVAWIWRRCSRARPLPPPPMSPFSTSRVTAIPGAAPPTCSRWLIRRRWRRGRFGWKRRTGTTGITTLWKIPWWRRRFLSSIFRSRDGRFSFLRYRSPLSSHMRWMQFAAGNGKFSPSSAVWRPTPVILRLHRAASSHVRVNFLGLMARPDHQRAGWYVVWMCFLSFIFFCTSGFASIPATSLIIGFPGW